MKKYYMHSLSNRIAFLVMIPLFIVGFYFIFKDAANDIMRIFGICFLTLLLGLVILLIIKFKAYGYLVFLDNKIIQKGFLCKKENYDYIDYRATLGAYSSIVEYKKVFIFLKKDGPIVTEIDTSKFGNVMTVNKYKILYCMYDENLLKFLQEKYVENELTYDEVIEKIQDKAYDANLKDDNIERLSSVERVVFVLNEFDIEIKNGGLCQFFVNSSSRYAPLISDYLDEVEAIDHKLLFDEFIYTYKIDLTNLRKFKIGELSEFIEFNQLYPFDTFDDEYYDLDELEDILYKYIRKHNLNK